MDKVKNYLRILAGISFTRPLLQNAGCDIDSGVVLLFDTESAARIFARNYCQKIDGKSVENLNKYGSVRNFEMGLHVFRANDDPAKVQDFLMNPLFFPVILTGGTVPNDLREGAYILRVSGVDVCEKLDSFVEEYENFKKYVIKNANFLQKELSRIQISTNHVEPEYSSAFKSFMAIGHVWKLYKRNIFSETEVEMFWKDYVEDCYEIVRKFSEYAGCYEIREEISALVWEYVDKHEEVWVSSVERVDEHTKAAIKREEVILFDEGFYYIPEKLVKIICRPFLVTISVGELKKNLKEEGIIRCNGTGFTVKKRYWHSYGACDRIRAMKFEKEILASSDGLLLEDVFGREETAGLVNLEGGERECM